MTQQELLFKSLKESVSPFACVADSKTRLCEAGFEELQYQDAWNLVPGGKYVLEHHGTTLFAFTIGKNYQKKDMVRMAVAHTDYPCFRLKPSADYQTNAYAQVNVEVYGGPIINTWLDRPLGVAGQVVLKGENAFEPKSVLFRSQKPVMIIPNLAIHMNRKVNEGVKLNEQVDLMPILDCLSKEQKTTDYFMNYLAEELQVAKEDILDFELNTFVMQEPMYVGISNSMISAPHLDNHTSVVALVSAMIDGEREDGINWIGLFDHEEVGNTSKQGAASHFSRDLIRRILKNLGADDDEVEQILYKAMILSVDVAHALHPNHREKMDITNQPVMGQGFCIKSACSQAYATDAQAAAILGEICNQKKIPYQRFVNRSDIPGGRTLGSVVATLVPVKVADIGIPLLSMHSAVELMGAADMDSLTDAVTAFFS